MISHNTQVVQWELNPKGVIPVWHDRKWKTSVQVARTNRFQNFLLETVRDGPGTECGKEN